MAGRIAENDLQAIIAVVTGHGEGLSVQQIHAKLGNAVALRTLQYHLRHLVGSGRLVRRGAARATRYLIPEAEAAPTSRYLAPQREAVEVIEEHDEQPMVISKSGAAIQKYVEQPLGMRKPVGYDRAFLDSYHPNETFYLTAHQRARLHRIVRPQVAQQPAGTYAGQILQRLLIDLSWNSSRLEGNTYDRLDTRRLINFGQVAGGKNRLEAQMILNHKDAIEFLVTNADEIRFNRHTILNLHAMLADNLLADPDSPGRLRKIAVGIGKSVFYPLELPQMIAECFDQILASADTIEDPFEQAFFVMVQIPHLQPFDDVNKRVSRLAANIPLIRANLAPLTFEDLPKDLYTQAVLGVYELNRIDLLKDVFIWAYERSATRYATVRQTVGEPDPFALRYRDQLHQIVGGIVRQAMGRKQAGVHILEWTDENMFADHREAFREMVETELLSLHEGNFARYRVRPAEFQCWQEVWSEKALA